MPRILKRCHVCQRLNAKFLVQDPAQGKIYLCHDCWMIRVKQLAEQQAAADKPS